jgi:Gpi18-like mannosyltransferase
MNMDSLRLKLLKLSKFILKHDLLIALILTASIVAIGSIISIENNRIALLNPSSVARYTAEPSNKLSFLANWDGNDYINIAHNGYDSFRLTNFFPLYPMLLNLMNKIISSPVISGLLISWVFFMGTIFYYLKLVKLLFKIKGVETIRATLLFVLFPTAIYFTAVYTESLFAFLALGAIYYALKRRYILSGVMAALAGATHTNGVFLLIFIGLILLEEKEKLRNILFSLVIGSLGIVSYMTYLWIKFKNPFEFLTAQHDHGWLRHSLLTQTGSFSGVDLLFAVLIIVTAVYWWNKRKSFSIYSLSYLVIPLLGGQFGGFPRYTLMVFPIPFMLYDLFKNNKLGYQVALLLMTIGWTYIFLQFAAGYIIS